MARVGDRVTVKISDAILAEAVQIRKGASMSVSGKIIEDLGHSWLVQLEISIEGKNQMVIPKGAEVFR